MFYTRLIEVCDKHMVKPTPLMKELGFSAGNIKRWQNGATVNSDILIALSKYFEVSVDYLLGITDDPTIGSDIYSKTECKIIRDYRGLSEQGQEYIQQQLFMAKEVFKKEQDIPQLAGQVI